MTTNTPHPNEINTIKNWLLSLLLNQPTTQYEQTVLTPQQHPPFSFTYNDKDSTALLPGWNRTQSAAQLSPQKTQQTVQYQDPQTKLAVKCVAVLYHDFPTVEWTLHFENQSDRDIPIIQNIRSLDITLKTDEQTSPALHHWSGDFCSSEGFQPLKTTLFPNTNANFAPIGGRPTNFTTPYFNLHSNDQSLIIVVGWPGQWAANFNRDDQQNIRITAGQQTTHLKLKPAEKIRTPLTVLQFSTSSVTRSQNIWRRWMKNYSMPRPHNKELQPLNLACSSHCYGEMVYADEASQIMFVDRYLEEGCPLDYWWMDAGWYPCDGKWSKTGTWEIDKTRFPNGFKPISDHAHKKDVKIIVWFEPERVTNDTWLADNHPEWLLSNRKYDQPRLLDLGNDDARNWLINHIDKMITEQGIDLYRQDFNMDPLAHWQNHDTPDRQGITENRYITGYLDYWDQLIKRHPNMIIDTCASGGRRLDLETIRRSVPLHRTDYLFDPIAHQCQTWAFSQWIPFHGTGTNACLSHNFQPGPTEVVPYVYWSNAGPSINHLFDMREESNDYNALRQLWQHRQQIKPYYLADFYPLTNYSLNNDVWMAWQFHDPDRDAGAIQIFRRDHSPYQSATFKLHALNPHDHYQLHNLTKDSFMILSGQDLLNQGLEIAINPKPYAVNIVYKKIQQ